LDFFLFCRTYFKIIADSESKCRSECVEVGVFPIVRVHVKSKTVHAGICVNETNGKIKARIYPFYCEKKVGKWKPDEKDREGIVAFSKPCPTATTYSERVIGTCP
uniref:SUEL-type lectin domain-containing protein n=1 Tax=Syphacia muris TaxID=451379 RepID=A0A0N5AK58_9BILA